MADFNQIAAQFVAYYYNSFDQFYNTAAKDRAGLATLYRPGSMLTYEDTQIMGVDAIVEKLTSLPFQSINHNLSTQDAQPSNAQGGILVMVTGSLRVDDGPNLLNYCQTFQLIPDTNGSYYVQNDVFRLNYG